MSAHRQPWTDADEALLIKLHRTHTTARIAVQLGRTARSINRRTWKMRRAGRFPSAHNTRWSARDIQQALYQIDSGRKLKLIARRLRRAPSALRVKLAHLRINLVQRHSRADGLNVNDVAQELGISRSAVWNHIQTGRLAATRRMAIGRMVYSVAQDDVRDFIAEYGGYVPLRPDEDWRPFVEEARAVFQRRYIARTALCTALWVCRKDIWRWEARRGFPAPALRLTQSYGGAHYERSAVWTWFVEHPEHMTRAAREELGR